MQAGLNTHGLKINMDSLNDMVRELNELDELTQIVHNSYPDMKDVRMYVQAAYTPEDGYIYAFPLSEGSYMEWAEWAEFDPDIVPLGDWKTPVSPQVILDTIADNMKGEDMITQLNMRIDSDVKAQAEKVCENIGLTLSAAINIYLRKIAAENRIPFDLTGNPKGGD